MKLTISRESCILIWICVVDALLTIVLLAIGLAEEANPLMARFLQYGFAAFYLVKLTMVVPAVAVAESYRRHNPMFVKKVLQTGTVSYLGLYFVLLVVVNTT
jgi:hypothetical protein